MQALAGRDVIVLQDNDAAGRKKALKAATVLHGVTKTVRIVSLPGLAEGEDVSDWLDLSRWNTIDKLIELSFSAPPWTPLPSTTAPAEPTPDPPPAAAPKLRISAGFSEIPNDRSDDDEPKIRIKPIEAKKLLGSICLVGTMNRGPNANGSF